MFKNLKSLFIIEDETAGKKETAESALSAPTPTATEKVNTVKVPTAENTPGEVTTQFTNILFRAMEQNNLDGFDYLEFKQSLRSLEKMPMDEATRYQSAFAMAQTMGATPQTLVQTAEHYINVLQQEQQKFDQALASQKMKQIGSKESEVQRLNETAKAKAEQIKKLTEEIAAHQKDAQALQQEIADATQKVESTKNNFIASYNALVELISRDVENIRQYLK